MLALFAAFQSRPLAPQMGWVAFTALAYLGLGWLFGSYTVLRWRRLPLRAVIQRVLITGLAMVVAVAVARLLVNPPELIWLVHRSTQVKWLLPLLLWSLLVRGLLRRGVLLPEQAQCLLVGADADVQPVLEAWRRTPPRQPRVSRGRCLAAPP